MGRFIGHTFWIGLALILSGCQAPTAPDQLILGEWAQIRPVLIEDTGVTLEVSEVAYTYRADGTFSNSYRLKLIGVPPALSEYRVLGRGSWRIADGELLEEMSAVEVEGREGNPQAAATAAQIRETMLAAGESGVEIRTLDNDRLNTFNAETGRIVQMRRPR